MKEDYLITFVTLCTLTRFCYRIYYINIIIIHVHIYVCKRNTSAGMLSLNRGSHLEIQHGLQTICFI